MWTAKKITFDAAQKMQINSGLLLKEFSITDPKAPGDKDIVCETTGNFKISCKPETVDWFDGVNNAPKNTKEGKGILGWDCSLSVTALSITEETLCLALGASRKSTDGGIYPETSYKTTDFQKLYWVGDMMDSDKALVVAMDDTVSTGGIDFTTSDGGKGELALELKPHDSILKPGIVPMAFYIITKTET